MRTLRNYTKFLGTSALFFLSVVMSFAQGTLTISAPSSSGIVCYGSTYEVTLSNLPLTTNPDRNRLVGYELFVDGSSVGTFTLTPVRNNGGTFTFTTPNSGTNLRVVGITRFNGTNPANAGTTGTTDPLNLTMRGVLGAVTIEGADAVCRDQADISYSASAMNNVGISFSKTAPATPANVMVSAAGVLALNPNYVGDVTMRATATGCVSGNPFGTRSAEKTVTVRQVIDTDPNRVVGAVQTCQGSTEDYNLSNSPADFKWQLTAAGASTINQNGTVSFASGFIGSANVQVVLEGCINPTGADNGRYYQPSTEGFSGPNAGLATITKPVLVRPNPQSNITFSLVNPTGGTFCGSGPITFRVNNLLTGVSAPNAVKFTLSDGTNTQSFTKAGQASLEDFNLESTSALYPTLGGNKTYTVKVAYVYNETALGAGDGLTCEIDLTTQLSVMRLNATPVSIGADQTVCADVAATFTATPACPTCTYQWFKNGNPINQNGMAASYTTPANGNQNGDYYVKVQGLGGCPGDNSSNVAVVRVNPVIVLTQDIMPTAVTKCTGETATFTASATGTAPMTVQWYKNGSAIGMAAAYTSGSSISHTTPALVAGDNGATYQARFTSACNNVNSGFATLTVNTPPSASDVMITNNNACEGSMVSFAASATGTQPMSWKWQKNGIDILGATGTGLSATYSISETVYSNDNGATYTVVFSNICGTDSKTSASLIVKERPKGSLSAVGTPETCPGVAINLAAMFTGTAPFPLQYKYSDGVMTFNKETSFANPDYIPVAPSATRTYKLVSISSLNGCTSRPSDLSGSVTVTVHPTTAITTQPVGGSFCITSPTTLSVGAVGGNLQYQWYKNNVRVGGATSATYTVPATANTPSGDNYYVEISGKCGQAVVSSTVNVKIFAEATGGTLSSTVSRVCATSNSGTLTVAGAGTSIVRWQSSTTGATGPWTNVANTTNTLSFTNLQATTWYRVEASNGPCQAFSNVVRVEVEQAPKAGNYVVTGPGIVSRSTSGQFTIVTVCQNTTVRLQHTGNPGTVVSWERAPTKLNAQWTTVSNQAALTLQVNNSLAPSVDFRVQLTNGGTCPIVTTTAKRLRIVVDNTCTNGGNGTGNDVADGKLQVEQLYPNPTHNILNIDVTNAAAGQASLEIIDVAGKVISSENRTLNAGNNTLQMNLESLTEGVYLIRLTDSAGTQVSNKVFRQ